jgi:hypothetical protein
MVLHLWNIFIYFWYFISIPEFSLDSTGYRYLCVASVDSLVKVPTYCTSVSDPDSLNPDQDLDH